ncbi:MAG: radical SAM protein [Syntrophomonas sp.]
MVLKVDEKGGQVIAPSEIAIPASEQAGALKLRQFELDKWNHRSIVLCGVLNKVARVADSLWESGLQNEVYICDDERAGEEYRGISIISSEALTAHRGDNLLLGSKVFYQKYRRVLQEMPLGDWFFMNQLLKDPYERKGYENAMYRFFKRRREAFILPGIDLVLTQRCNLRCRHCANRMQYYTAPRDYPEKDYLESFARVLNAVDGVAGMRIIGGEPLLLPERIDRVIELFGNSDKIFCIDIPTNGTLLLKEKTAALLAGCPKATILVSDYGAPSRRVKELMVQLKEYKISHMLYPPNTPWYDLGELKLYERSEEETQSIYNCCLSKEGCATLLGRELYLCPVAAHGAALAAVPRLEEEYVDLYDDSYLRERLLRFYMRKTYLNACRFCLGGRTIVPRGEQSPHVLPYQVIEESGSLL